MEDIFNAGIAQQALERFQQMTAATFQRAVERENLVATKELYDSIQVGALEVGKDVISASVYFSYLMRIKDMKSLNYSTLPPVNAMVKFVESHGVNSFPYVPGYRNGMVPTDSVAVERIASALTFHFKSTPNVKRGYRGIYNDEKMLLIARFDDELRNYAAQYAQEFIRGTMGKENIVVVPLMQNVTRKMASQGAYDEGKIDTSKLHLNFR